MRQDIFREFKYEPKTNRYRIVSGAGKGQYISKDAFLESTRRHILEKSEQLASLTIKDPRAFQKQAAEILKDLHTSQAILGHNGVENVKAEDWLRVGRELKRQYYQGIDPDTKKKFGLRQLTEEYLNGNVSDAQLRNRLKMYADNSKKAFWQAQESDGKEYAKRTLGIAEHCPDCVSYAAMGIRPKGELPLPTERCQCMSQCKCSIVFMSLSEAVKSGYKKLSE